MATYSMYANLHDVAVYVVWYGDMTESEGPFANLSLAKRWVRSTLFSGVPFIIYRERVVCRGVR